MIDPLYERILIAIHATGICERGAPGHCGHECRDAADNVLAEVGGIRKETVSYVRKDIRIGWIHSEIGDGPNTICFHCGGLWPCRTIRILDGENE